MMIGGTEDHTNVDVEHSSSVIVMTGNVKKCNHLKARLDPNPREELLTSLKCTISCWIKYHQGQPVLSKTLIGHPKLMHAVKDREGKEIAAKFFCLDHDCATEHLRTAVESAVTSLETDKLDSLTLASYNGTVNDEFLNAWKVMENLHDEGLIGDLSTADLDVDHLKSLIDNAKYAPTQLEIPQDSCCHVPEDLDKMCKDHGILLLGHDDPMSDIMTSEDIQEIMSKALLGETILTPLPNTSPTPTPPGSPPSVVRRPLPTKWKAQWVLRYTVIDRLRSVIDSHGYLLGISFVF